MSSDFLRDDMYNPFLKADEILSQFDLKEFN